MTTQPEKIMSQEQLGMLWHNVGIIEGFILNLLNSHLIPGNPCEQSLAFMAVVVQLSITKGNVTKEAYLEQCGKIWDKIEEEINNGEI